MRQNYIQETFKSTCFSHFNKAMSQKKKKKSHKDHLLVQGDRNRYIKWKTKYERDLCNCYKGNRKLDLG